jgi:NAD(P)-dependent dehydrogenase (short-subunit alcohol dehydrogenase family)
MNLDRQAAIVTGGGSGLGAAVAVRLAAAGCRVTVLDLNGEAAEAVGRQADGAWARCDVGDAASAEAAFAAAHQAHGPVRLLVNCAGIAPAGRIVSRNGPMRLEDFERVIRVNLIGTFNMLRLAASEMRALDPTEDNERGVIVNTASIAGYEGQIGQAAYAASKAGVIGLTLQSSRELAQYGIRVVTIAPGLMWTPMLDAMPEEVRHTLAGSVPFPSRLGMPEEFASLALHIAQNRYLNGETIRLDGALRMPPR